MGGSYGQILGMSIVKFLPFLPHVGQRWVARCEFRIGNIWLTRQNRH